MYFYDDNESVTKSIDTLALSVVEYMKEHGVTLSAAESCTGGLFSAAITSVSGASEVFMGSAVTYTEQIKQKVLGVRADTLEKFTVYSSQTAYEMAEGAAEVFETDWSVAVTGIAGPNGGTAEKPVGTVYVCVYSKDKSVTENLKLYEEKNYEKLDRKAIRQLTVLRCLDLLLKLLTDTK